MYITSTNLPMIAVGLSDYSDRVSSHEIAFRFSDDKTRLVLSTGTKMQAVIDYMSYCKDFGLTSQIEEVGDTYHIHIT